MFGCVAFSSHLGVTPRVLCSLALILGSRRAGVSRSERDMFLVAFWMARRRPLCHVLVVAVAVCHVSASQRLSPFPGTPILGSPLREVSGLRVCSNWQPTVRSGSACGPSTLWRSEEAVLVVRRRSHLVAARGLGSCCCGCVPRVRIAGVKATCQVSRSPEAPARATHGLAPVGLSEVFSYCSGRGRTGNPYWALFARLTPLLPSARGSSSRELGVGRVVEAGLEVQWMKKVEKEELESEEVTLYPPTVPETPEAAMEMNRESFWRIMGRNGTEALMKFWREQRIL
ncbi:hypothetical protein Taro_016191 [Colocasia esculenta]|uniref:Uncharacterized protein n=1 Tax=Colocasia esculenta TaxID=4460 RepID=A0A843UN62_COLES|nr:hypothetical protein [Colocasia esculenta]